MNSRQAVCGGKRRHPHRRSAEGHRQGLIRAGAAAWLLRVYRCRYWPAALRVRGYPATEGEAS